MKDGACFILYPDFRALMDSEELDTWLDKLSGSEAVKLNHYYLDDLSNIMQSAPFCSSVQEIVNPPDSDDSGDESPDPDDVTENEPAAQAGPLTGKRSRFPGTGSGRAPAGGGGRKKGRESI